MLEEFLWESWALVPGSWEELRRNQIQAVVLDPVQAPDEGWESAVETTTSSNDERETAWLLDLAPARLVSRGCSSIPQT